MAGAALPRMIKGSGNLRSRRIPNIRVMNSSDPNGRSALGYPIRVESPAARMTGRIEATESCGIGSDPRKFRVLRGGNCGSTQTNPDSFPRHTDILQDKGSAHGFQQGLSCPQFHAIRMHRSQGYRFRGTAVDRTGARLAQEAGFQTPAHILLPYRKPQRFGASPQLLNTALDYMQDGQVDG